MHAQVGVPLHCAGISTQWSVVVMPPKDTQASLAPHWEHAPTLAHWVVGTHDPQHAPSTAGVVPARHTGVGTRHITLAGSQFQPATQRPATQPNVLA